MSRRVGLSKNFPHVTNRRHDSSSRRPSHEKQTNRRENTAESSQSSRYKSDLQHTQAHGSSSEIPFEDDVSVRTECGSNEEPYDSKNSQYTLLALPDDVLYVILAYLQPKDLCRLSCVCQRFHDLTSKDSVWVHHAKRIGVVKQFSNW